MIRRPLETFQKKRWVFKLADLNLEPLKLGKKEEEEGKEAEGDGGEVKVGNLIAPNIIVSEEYKEGNARKFAMFDNYVQVYRLCESIRLKGEIPHLYELCPYYMKIHFDIDVTKDKLEEASVSEKDLKELFEGETKYYYILRPYLKATEEIFKRLFPNEYTTSEAFFRNMLVFEAHRAEKISFHINLDGFYLSCNDCWTFCKEVVNQLVSEGNVVQSQMADFSVYKKNQSFRMFGSNKFSMRGKEGIKRIYNGPDFDFFSRDLMIKSCFPDEPLDPNLVNLRVLERSLISNTLGNTRLTINKPKEAGSSKGSYSLSLDNEKRYSMAPLIEMQDDEIAKIMEVFFRHPCSQTTTKEKAFGFLKYVPRGGLICLKRTKENYCKVCNKNHEAENAFLVCSPTGDVSFVCRRAQESKQGGSCLYVGNITQS